MRVLDTPTPPLRAESSDVAHAAVVAELVERRGEIGQRRYRHHAAGALAQLAVGLGPAQQQLDEHRGLAALDLERIREAVLVAVGPSAHAADERDQLLRAQRIERVEDLVLPEIRHRIAAALLVAAVDEAIEGQRVLLGSRQTLLGQHTEHSSFIEAQLERHSRPPREGTGNR